MKYISIVLFIGFLFLISLETTTGARGVIWLEITGYISPGTAEHVEEHMRSARNYIAVLITIDTLGGQADAMIRIIEAIQSSPVPVIGFVYPAGGKALSAGSFILMATDYAAMAPGTLIGSAQPVVGGVPSNDTKIVNFFVAKMRTMAELHDRNPAEAEKLITQNKNFNPESALSAGLIEAIASSPEELLLMADGMEVNTMRGRVKLQTAGHELVRSGMSLRSMAISALSDPMVSGILLTIGIIALVAGLLSPGWGAEIAGGVMIILGLIGQGFNINLAGALLAAVGAGLLIFELHTPSFGAIGAGGVIALSIGLILLVGYPPSTTFLPASWLTQFQSAVIIIAISTVSVLAFLGYKALATAKRRPVPWEPSGVGRAVDDIPDGGEGYVVVMGEYWRARAKGNVKMGARVKVVGKENNILVVEPSD
ncbi:MAG: nodulation protein NfeD [Nitrososphaerota archaeon]